MSSSALKHLARFDRLHNPPHKPHYVPFCGTIRLENYNKPVKPMKRGVVWNEKEEKKTNSSSVMVSADEDRDEASASDGMITKANNSALPGPSNKSKSEVKNGVIETLVDGDWQPVQFEPIMMRSLKLSEPPDHGPFHPRTVLQRHAIYLVRLAKVIAPNSFYMEFIIEPPKDGYKTWDDSLQAFYGDPENQEKYKLRSVRPFVGQMYAVKDKRSEKWERIRVLRIDYYNENVHAMCMDRLLLIHFPFTSLWELHPKFANWHRYPINGGLVDIHPIHKDTTEDVNCWPDDAVEFFKSYAVNKTFRAFVVNKQLDRKDNVWHANDEDRFTKLAVILFEVGNDIPVNVLLVQKGYAKPIRSMVDCLETAKTLHGLG